MGDANPYLIAGFFLIAIFTASAGLLIGSATRYAPQPRSKLVSGFVESIAFTFASSVAAIIAFRVCFAIFNSGGYPGVVGMIFLMIALFQSVVNIGLVVWSSRRIRPLSWKWKLPLLLLSLPLPFIAILFLK